MTHLDQKAATGHVSLDYHKFPARDTGEQANDGRTIFRCSCTGLRLFSC